MPNSKTLRANFEWAPLVPEFLVSDIQVSVNFWCDVLGFTIAYDRRADNFYYLEYGRAQIMLDQRNNYWETGPLEIPFGRGLNFQIDTEELDALRQRLITKKWPIYEEREKTYQTGGRESRQRELMVQDPDGYLLRFAMTVSRD